MAEVFFCGDHHFGHNNIIKFTDSNGNRYRPFDSIQDMHDIVIANHNSVVGKEDIVYFLGDVAFNKKYMPLLHEMNGIKYLVKGNHDSFHASTYMQYFKDIFGVVKKYDYALTHVPVHPSQLDRWKLNIHGHLHADRVLDNNIPDLKYYNVSLEAINFTPVSLDVINDFVISRGF